MLPYLQRQTVQIRESITRMDAIFVQLLRDGDTLAPLDAAKTALALDAIDLQLSDMVDRMDQDYGPIETPLIPMRASP